MVSFSSGFTAARSRVALMKRQRKSILQLLTAMAWTPMSNWIIPLNFVNHCNTRGRSSFCLWNMCSGGQGKKKSEYLPRKTKDWGWNKWLFWWICHLLLAWFLFKTLKIVQACYTVAKITSLYGFILSSPQWCSIFSPREPKNPENIHINFFLKSFLFLNLA